MNTTKISELLLEVVLQTEKVENARNPFDAYDECQNLIELLGNFTAEVKGYQEFCENACDVQTP